MKEKVLRFTKEEIDELVLIEATRRGLDNPSWWCVEVREASSMRDGTSYPAFDGYSVGMAVAELADL